MSKHTITLKEPAERPVEISISLAELNALVAFHKKQMRSGPATAGKIMAKEKLSPRQLTELQSLICSQIDAHLKRAQGLHSILSSFLENQPS